MQDLVFGWRTAILAVAVVQLLAIAAGLTRSLANRTANRTLAALLVVLAGIVTPWMIGFAGFYDRWPWLSFAPFSITLAVAPLLWLYAQSLVNGGWPARGRLHLAPAALQFAFLAASFALPMPLKERWADLSAPVTAPAFALATVAGLALYGLAGLRLLALYRRRLAAERSDDWRFAARWLSRATGALMVLLPIWATYAIWDAVAPLGYWKLMGLHVAIAAFGLYLGIEGWRHADLPFPHFGRAEPEPA
ncbi:MAG: AraC family transcriptional regulator, partial [Allosphingosinicella sp.]